MLVNSLLKEIENYFKVWLLSLLQKSDKYNTDINVWYQYTDVKCVLCCCLIGSSVSWEDCGWVGVVFIDWS